MRNVVCAAREGYRILLEHCYSDDGVSGLTTARPALDRLLTLLARGEAPFERVYVTDPTRLGRSPDPRQYVYWRALGKRLGIEIPFSKHVPTPLQGGAQ